ncbi:damage-specific DNA binding protein 1 [Phaeodactylum tricornutum CCAP 1055/1]|uniref:Damage-specific DNA binding protein 1 n=4 Tax=Phaeodactylum tricornutum TaxID=2850 RepID=B7G6V5_PHATC|nr:damage-specific DNA binding protein 1 [Phaeodactylum tricornutum CCAP 1055/1]EEC45658.1 damage-specific DNA binding protein 1 [Phaeodactylum tricornutum CCAP 1055/1]|eukprot:XP_002182922.1 damage-specific DNA binding protein 1 [Phaeodactylum tricornutum CCAP 1055/1]
MSASTKKEAAHYVVTAHPPGGVLLTAKCNFTSPFSLDVLVAKSRRLEVRQLRTTTEGLSPFPILASVPINGRIVGLVPFKVHGSDTSYVFVLTARQQYAVLAYDRTNSGSAAYPLVTLASGTLQSQEHAVLGQEAESGPIVAIDHFHRCIALHVYDGLLTIIPSTRTLASQQLLGTPFHCRIEERTILHLAFLQIPFEALPQLAVLHQDARGAQHITSHVINWKRKNIFLYGSSSAPAATEWLQKSNVDGGSSLIIPVPAEAPPDFAPAKHRSGGVLVVGQRQLTFINNNVTKVVPIPQALHLCVEELPADPNGGLPRYLLADEFGNLHMVTIVLVVDKVVALQIDTLGSCTLATSIAYLREGLVFVGSTLGDPQLIQIHDEPIVDVEDEEDMVGAESSYLSVVEEYTHLGPILDFDLVPTAPGGGGLGQTEGIHGPSQSQVVTASGSSKSGSLRLIRNGIGMNESAAVEIPGIQNVWSLRRSFADVDDTYLVQSFVHETRVLGVTTMDDMSQDEKEGDVAPGGTLEEVFLIGLKSSCATLYVGNVQAHQNGLLQITEGEVRFATMEAVLDTWLVPSGAAITVGTANEAGQIAVALNGGKVLYLKIEEGKIRECSGQQMEREVSCLNLNPFAATSHTSSFLAVGLWDDFTVRLFLCLITLDFSSGTSGNTTSTSTSLSSTGSGVNMLFVGLGDGTLISFAVVERGASIFVQSKKEVCLGTQRIDLVPLCTEQGGTCVLATGDRPTVIYLAGVGGISANQFNPKLCYSNVNLSAGDDEEEDDVSRPPSQQSIVVNVATPFSSSLLFDSATGGSQRYSLCVADDSFLRMGIIDDIQKLHVTTCRLGMAPCRIVHCADGRLFAVGCIESGIKQFSLGGDEANMGNCIRFMDDANFDDIHRVDLEPFEMILSMVYATLRIPSDGDQSDQPVHRPFLLVGTAYAMPDEDEPSRGRILVYSCQADEASGTPTSTRAVRQITEMSTQGGVYSICQFYDGNFLCTVNSKTHVVQIVADCGVLRLEYVGIGHHGHIVSLFVKSRAKPLAIVGDLMRSVSLMQYYPQHETLEEVARDFNPNWTTAVEMLTDDVYIGAENWNNLFCLRRNKAATSEEIRCRLDNIGEFHLGEMCNKFMSGSLVMPVSSNSTTSSRRATLFGTVEGSLGVILGLDGRTAAFFITLERAIAKTIQPVGGFSHQLYRSCQAELRVHPAHGFVDGDLVETFLDLDRRTMEAVVAEMNRDGGWEVDDFANSRSDENNDSSKDTDRINLEERSELSIDDVLAMVEEMTMLH